MTKKISLTKRSPSLKAALFGLACFFFFALSLKNPTVSAEQIKKGLSLCGTTLIPSLFPLMVLSEFLISCGLGQRLGDLLGSPLRLLFGISESGCCALLLGWLFGFPVGAKAAVSLYDTGVLTKRETERLLAVCNIPGIGFVVGTVGLLLFHDRAFGLLLYAGAIFSAILFGILLRLFSPFPSSSKKAPAPRPSFTAAVFTHSVSTALSSMLSVCAYVLFFSAFVGCFSFALSAWNAPAELQTFLFGVFEISSASGSAALIPNRISGAALCGFAIGWSGISVHFQILSFCSDRGLSFRPFFAAKAFQGVFCALIAFLYKCLL